MARTIGATFLPGVSKTNSGGGLPCLDGVEVRVSDTRGGKEGEPT